MAVPVNIELTEFSEPLEIEISEVKYVKYRKKDHCLDMDFKERGRKSMYFGFSDIEQNSKSFVDNVSLSVSPCRRFTMFRNWKGRRLS